MLVLLLVCIIVYFCLRRCIAVSSVGIFLYEELSHDTNCPKIKESVHVLLAGLRVSNILNHVNFTATLETILVKLVRINEIVFYIFLFVIQVYKNENVDNLCSN